MYIKSFRLGYRDRGKKLWYIVTFALTMASLLIATSFYLVSNESFKIKLNIGCESNIFNMDSYYTEYTVKINSNKNSNVYYMKEWHMKKDDNSESFKFETSNELGNTISYIIANNSLKITNSAEKYEYFLSEYIVNKKNLLSISTFIDIYNKVKGGLSDLSNCCKVESVVQDNVCNYKIIFGENSNNNSEINDYDIQNVSNIELIVNQENSLPEHMYVYDKNGNAFIDITYNFFGINSVFEEKLFAFLDK